MATDPPPHVLMMGVRDSYAQYVVRYWLNDLAIDDPTDSTVRIRVWFAANILGDVARQNPLAKLSQQFEPVQRELDRWSRMNARDNRYAYCFCDVR